jgi:hypothetical protein
MNKTAALGFLISVSVAMIENPPAVISACLYNAGSVGCVRTSDKRTCWSVEPGRNGAELTIPYSVAHIAAPVRLDTPVVPWTGSMWSLTSSG